MSKNLCLLGSTGSIGQSTLQVVRHLKDQFRVVALAARSQIALLDAQIDEFQPQVVAVYDEEAADTLRRKRPNLTILSGMEGLREVASYASVDRVLSALSGAVGILPTLDAIEAGKDIALANKEVLVSAGALVMNLVEKTGVSLLPVDSEHSALFQCLQGRKKSEVRRLILTASGGPFLRSTSDELAHVTVEQALGHPTWKMGPKITIDSSTLMNKGLEVIEAHWLFGIEADRIEVVIHPESTIHSLVEFIDGSILAQMSQPNMVGAIQYALTYPNRRPGLLSPYDFTKPHALHFAPPDQGRFPCLRLAYEALRKGGVASCFLNAANEVLVEQFLNRQMSWREIGTRLEELMPHCPSIEETGATPSLEKILETDTLAREIGFVQR